MKHSKQPIGQRLASYGLGAVALLGSMSYTVRRWIGKPSAGSKSNPALPAHSEEGLRAAADSALDAVISADCHGNIIYWNRGAERMFGYSPDAVLGRPLTVLMPDRFRDAHRAGIKRMATTGESRVIGRVVELAGLRKDGSIFPLELSLTSWETAEGRFFTGIIRDITERKHAEERLTYLKEYIHSILESIPNPIIILEHDARVQYINRAAKEALSLGDANLRDSTLFDLLQTDNATREQLRLGLTAYVENQQGPLKVARRSPPREQPLDPLTPPPAGGQQLSRRELNIGTAVYQYDWFPVSARSGGERLVGLALRDTTEESRLHDQLIQAEKLTGIALLISGLAHELNNPLYSVLGMSEAILDETDPQTMKEHAKIVVEEAKRMARIIRDLAEPTRMETPELREDVDVFEQLDQAVELAKFNCPAKDLEVRKTYQGAPRMRANALEIRQVFVNVITNALQAMQGRGILDLTTKADGQWLRIRIRDSGPGIPAAYVSKIFDPFFTTKRQGEGDGLGLTIARRLVTKHGGDIHVETEPGRGATFVISFPLSE